jgi:hypothetical protein
MKYEMRVLKILKVAREILAKYGWSPQNLDGKISLAMAIRLAGEQTCGSAADMCTSLAIADVANPSCYGPITEYCTGIMDNSINMTSERIFQYLDNAIALVETWRPSMVTEALKRMHQIITEGWCKQYLAVDGDGWPCATISPKMKKCCLVGATTVAVPRGNLFGLTRRVMLDLLLEAINKTQPSYSNISDANDDNATTHPLVIDWIREAIALAKELEPTYVPA